MNHPFKIVAILLGMFALSSCYYDNEEELYPNTNVPCDSVVVSFKTDVDPILQNYCVGCHNANNPGGGYIYDTYADTKNSVDDGTLLGVTNHYTGFSSMPKGGSKLPSCELGKIRNWINEGALNN
ncbi:MAG: hypothetical protein RIS99_313 [Bacteroidota bacterium]|jgi:hypothetical protein